MFERRNYDARYSNRRKVHGVGTNDAEYAVSYRGSEGRLLTCPYYSKWEGMLRRCYSPLAYPTYKGCTVIDEWLLFSNFRSWMEKQDWQGKQLDKDILVIGNKIYGKATCIFVSAGINSLMLDSRKSRGKYPLGVDFSKNSGKYRARCRVGKVSKALGYYKSPQLAHLAYLRCKLGVVTSVLDTEEVAGCIKLKCGILQLIEHLKDKIKESEDE